MSFSYNDEGLRVTKTVNGVTTNYYYQGSVLYAEETDEAVIVYIYDQNGSPMGFQYHGADYANGVWDGYAYEKNMFGDIVAVYDVSTGLKLISYTYDAWGVCTNATYYNNGATTSVVHNPYRYRGYYYDEDLCMYYLQSRYYDPVVCRFINADSILYHSMLGYNLFAYCENNPVMYVDPTGESAEIAQNIAIYTWLLSFLDGPLPIGDILFWLCIGIIAVDFSKNIFLQTKNKTNDNTPKDKNDVPSDVVIPEVEYPGDDPTIAPDGYSWTGPDPQGGANGGYKNNDPNKKDSWHPDLNHGGKKGPHWDYTDIFKNKWAVTRESGKTVIRYWINKKIIWEIFMGG